MTSFKLAKFDIVILTAILVVLAYMLSVDMHLWRPGKVVWDFRKSNAVSIVGWPRDPRRHFWFFPRMDFELAMTLPGGQMLSGKMRLAAFYRAGGKLASIKVSGEANTLGYWKPRLYALMVRLHFPEIQLSRFRRFCIQDKPNPMGRDMFFDQRSRVPLLEFEFRDLKDDDPAPATSRQWAPTFCEYWTPGGGGNIGKRLGTEETAAPRHLTGPVVWDFRKAHTIAQMRLTPRDINPLGSYPEQNFRLTIRLPGRRTFAGVADSAILRAVGERVQSFIVNGRPAALQIWVPRVRRWINSLKLPPAAARQFAVFARNIGKPGFRRSITLRDFRRYPKIEITLTGLNRRKNGQLLYDGSLEVYWLRNLPSWY